MNKQSLSVDDLLKKLSDHDVLEALSDTLNVPLDELSSTVKALRENYESVDSSETSPLHLYVDGASRGNPGPAGGGAALFDEDDEIIRSKAEFFGKAVTNNEAEYRALLLGLDLIPSDTNAVNIFMDSELAIKQLNGEYQVKSESLRPYFERAKRQIDDLGSVSLGHVPREDNETADQLANQAIDRHQRRESIG
jgi:ribonuclease HI